MLMPMLMLMMSLLMSKLILSMLMIIMMAMTDELMLIFIQIPIKMNGSDVIIYL